VTTTAQDDDAVKSAISVLFDGAGRRRLPLTAELDRIMSGSLVSLSSTLYSRENPAGVELWHLPTVEWIDGLTAWIRSRNYTRVLEVGAGDGFVAHLLRERLPGVEVVAQDNRRWAEHTHTLYPPVIECGGVEDCGGAIETARVFQPDLILWIWAPMGAVGADELLGLCREYLLVGESEDGCTGGFPSNSTLRVEDEALVALERFARCRTDFWGALHTQHTLYKGARS